MNILKLFFFWGLFLACGIVRSPAVTRFVDPGCASPQFPYTSWVHAANNINDAVNAANSADTILVTNGIYQTGGVSFSGASNRVYVTKSVAIQSVNGPAATIIKGYQVPGTTNGTSAVRCVYLTGGASLSGFTLTGGATTITGNGGGIYANGQSTVIVSNCIITGNAAKFDGGGAYQGTFYNCIFAGNTTYGSFGGGAAIYAGMNNCLVISNNASTYGGGVYNGTMRNCTFVGNYATLGGGAAYGGTLYNCILYYNAIGANLPSGTNGYNIGIYNCCVAVTNGLGLLNGANFTNAPQFVNPTAGNFRLLPSSPCVNTGSNSAAPAGLDLDGNARTYGSAVDLGPYENQFAGPVRFVDINSTNPVTPYTNWLTAATNIQDAVDAASPGDFIAVNSGMYKFGGRAAAGWTTLNRVTVDKPVTVQGVNGAAATFILGVHGTTTVRCAYLTNGAALTGFTLTNGGAFLNGPVTREVCGGGVYCEASGVTVSNCVFSGNTAAGLGGAAFQGTLVNCVLSNSTAINGGGAASNTLVNCTLSQNQATGNYGGGAFYGTLTNCLLAGNLMSGTTGGGGGAGYSTLSGCVVSNNAAVTGGGLYNSMASSSLIASNHALSLGGAGAYNFFNNCVLVRNLAQEGGAAYRCGLINCTVVSNTATSTGGGVNDSGVTNCIVYFNTAPFGSNYSGTVPMIFCDTTPLTTNGYANLTNDPALVNLAGGDCHLQAASPCINSGNNSYVTTATDLDGNPRLAGGTVDIGAYEVQSPASVVSYAYLQQYGLPTDGSADKLDSDGDGFSNYAEWIAGTNPTNAASGLQLKSIAPAADFSSATLTWPSVSGVNYLVLRGPDLTAPLTIIATNIIGQAGTTSYTDTNAVGTGPFFYRVGATR